MEHEINKAYVEELNTRIKELNEDNIRLRRRLRVLAERESEHLNCLSKIDDALRKLWGGDTE